MKLYYAETPNSRKACAVARHLDSPVAYVPVDLKAGAHKAPDFLAINPNGKVPVLTDGDFNLFESNAIMVYLAQQAGADMWPADPAEQVEAIKWLSWDTAHFSRHGGTLFFENLIKPQFGFGDPDPAAIEEATGFFRAFAGVLDAHLAGREYLVGRRLTVADIAVATMLPLAGPAQLPLGDFKEVSRWHDSLMALPAWAEPFPKRAAAA